MRHRGSMERGVLVGVAALRWAGWLWLAVLALANLGRVDDPWLTVAAIAATLLVTIAAQLALRGEWQRAMRPGLVTVEIAVAAAVILADGWVHQGRLTGQSLAGIWPLAAILVSAVAGGARAGAGVGLLLSAARAGAAVVTGTASGQAGRVALATVSTSVSWVVFGAVCGAIVHLVRRTQNQLAAAEVRERIARDLHDGVLQTLALIERRSTSPDISRLAREQERELRAYLFDDRIKGGTLTAQLRTIGARLERAWPQMTVTVTVTGDAPEPEGAQLDAALGATLEALTNAAKHGRARHATVFADLDESTGGLFFSVKDDGVGFDAANVAERVGMSQSIRGRVEGAGGHVEFTSTPGDGTDVRMAFPSIRRSRASRA